MTGKEQDESAADTIALWRPTGQAELDLVAASGWRAWPPRLPDQPIFYPVLNRWYATKIAREWNVPAGGVGYVTRFEVQRRFLDRYQVHQVSGRDVLEYWIPAEELADLNAATSSVRSLRKPTTAAPWAMRSSPTRNMRWAGPYRPHGGTTCKAHRGFGEGG